MRTVLQRVSSASVVVESQTVGSIAHGWLVLLGVAPTDTIPDAQWLAEKIAYLRAFNDSDGKMNLAIHDVKGSVLVVSNFTLYGECQKGRRPSFTAAARPETASPLCDEFVNAIRAHGVPAATGIFGADMQVSLVNDGPVTLIIDSPKRFVDGIEESK